MSALRVLAAAGALALAALSGCGGGAAVDRAPAPSVCGTRVTPDHPADVLTVALFDSVDWSHAPWPRTREERFVFAHLYETLITVDCHGAIQPALARSWKRNGNSWELELRDDARFWDGSRVTVADVDTCLERARDMSAFIDFHVVIDDAHVAITLLQPDSIGWLAQPMLAVAKHTASSRLSLGTGPWRIHESPIDPHSPVVMRPAFGRPGPVVRFVGKRVNDARDIFVETVDAMVTDDPAVIDYARGHARTAMAPLAWDQVYVLLSTSRVDAIYKGDSVPTLPASQCDAIARDAVRVDARGGSSLIADSEAANRHVPFIGDLRLGHFLPGTQRVLYDATDPTARDLVDRIVALAAMDTASSADARAIARAIPDLSGGKARAVGVTAAALAASLQHANDFAYVLRLSWTDYPTLVGQLRNPEANFLHYEDAPLAQQLLPLVETRAHFVAMSDRIGFIDDGHGGVRILNPEAEPR